MYLEQSRFCSILSNGDDDYLDSMDVDSIFCSRVSRRHEALIRATDILVSCLAIILFLPLMIVVAFGVVISDRGPIFFRQSRLGKGGRLFHCYKFRTMVVDANARLKELLASDPGARAEWARDQKLKKDPRTTRIGEFLRRSSLDELPQLFNVLRGDMSIVGPRPIVIEEIVRYRRYFREYCVVRPGITGLWQVSGRNHVSYRRRVAMDVCFVRSRSFWLHLRIMAATIPSVGLARGAF